MVPLSLAMFGRFSFRVVICFHSLLKLRHKPTTMACDQHCCGHATEIAFKVADQLPDLCISVLACASFLPAWSQLMTAARQLSWKTPEQLDASRSNLWRESRHYYPRTANILGTFGRANSSRNCGSFPSEPLESPRRSFYASAETLPNYSYCQDKRVRSVR